MRDPLTLTPAQIDRAFERLWELVGPLGKPPSESAAFELPPDIAQPFGTAKEWTRLASLPSEHRLLAAFLAGFVCGQTIPRRLPARLPEPWQSKMR